MTLQLSEEQRDALQELMNISMGQAAQALALLIATRISLSIPQIRLISAAEFDALLGAPDQWLTRQSFQGAVRGEVLTALSEAGLAPMAALLDYPKPLPAAQREALVVELANILAGVCLRGFAAQLDLATRLSMPVLFRFREAQLAYHWQQTLLLTVELTLTDTAFSARLMICLDPKSVTVLLERLNKLLQE